MSAIRRASFACLFLSLLPCGPAARAQGFEWAGSFRGTGTERLDKIAVDANGNVYGVGNFAGWLDIDPGPATQNLITQGTGSDGYVWKLDGSGALVWAAHLITPGAGSILPEGLSVDGAGNVYAAGRYSGMADFDPGPGAWNLTPTAGTEEAWVLKLNSAGGFVWARTARPQTGGNTWARAVELDASENHLLITGTVSGTGDFDPGPGTANLTSTGSGSEGFVWKLDTDGNFVWVRQFTGSTLVSPSSLALDPSDNVYLAGSFRDTVDFDPGPGTFGFTSAGGSDAFACKLDSAGGFVWARAVSGTSGQLAQELALDSAGNVLVVGNFAGVTDFDPAGSGALLGTPSNLIDAFVWKLDSDGNFIWVRQAGGTGSDGAFDVAVDSSDNAYLAGSFDLTSIFGTINLVSAGGFSDGYLAKLDSGGTFLWALPLGAMGYDQLLDVTLDSSNNIYASGHFELTVDFDPGSNTFDLTSTGTGGDPFLLKLHPGFSEFAEYCTGDGGNQMGCTDCPCANNAPVGSAGGCLNSSGNGTRLLATGDESVSLPTGATTDLRFGATGAPPGSLCVLNSGDNLAPNNAMNPCFGSNSGVISVSFDGLRCAVGATRRHGGRGADVNGEVGVTNNPWGGEGGPPDGIAVVAAFASGQTRNFQIIHRDNAALGCMTGLNTSQAVRVTFTP